MEDILTSNISLALYCYLCQKIVGTEDHVKTIRFMNIMRDNFSSNKRKTHITSGSFGEGLEMRGSDLDIMTIYKVFEVYEYVKPILNPDVIYFTMETDDIKPCYTQLRLEYSRLQFVFQCCGKHHDKYYLSSALVKQNVYLGSKNSVIHGPCLSDEKGFLDLAFTLHCKTWISSAVQWVTRSSSSWPSHHVKQSIIKHGVLFVPIGVNGSPKEGLEWRVSFSVAEKLLINTFTHTQLLCYALLKIILKDVIANYPECEDLICSYYIKTIIFRISEELPLSVWKPDNLIACFMRCLGRLVYCVEHSVCWHYFIPENNLFENKIDGHARHVLLEKINMIHSYGWRCILLSNQISNFQMFHVSMWNFPIKSCNSYINHVEKVVNSLALFSIKGSFEYSGALDIFNIGLIQNILSQQSSRKQLYTYCISLTCNRQAQNLPLNSVIINNKFQYKQYKSCLSTLLTNVYHDAVSGWLMLASFFYETKNYMKALHIIVYSISKCTHEKLYYGMTMSNIHYEYLKLQPFHKKNVVRLLKIMHIDNIRFTMNSKLMPDELRMNEWNQRMFLASTSFAYFLSFLCHYHLNNVRQCQDSIQGLQVVIEERYLMTKNWICIANAYCLLGIALQLFGDKESARQAFVQSVKLCPNVLHNSAIIRLLFMG